VRVKLAEVNLKSGISEREATACNYEEEEWPEEFIFHGAGDDINVDDMDVDDSDVIASDEGGITMLPLSG
jgi:hypothetical protein